MLHMYTEYYVLRLYRILAKDESKKRKKKRKGRPQLMLTMINQKTHVHIYKCTCTYNTSRTAWMPSLEDWLKIFMVPMHPSVHTHNVIHVHA